jgi:hypothetical protein
MRSQTDEAAKAGFDLPVYYLGQSHLVRIRNIFLIAYSLMFSATHAHTLPIAAFAEKEVLVLNHRRSSCWSVSSPSM